MKPTFTVIIPAKDRPKHVKDALLSALRQTGPSFEIILSNNGANREVRDSVRSLISDSRVIYLEQENVLSMPDHWEKLASLANGEYVTILPDRSVLKHGALEKIARAHRAPGADASVISWPWDLFYDSGILMSNASSEGCVELNSDDLIINSTGMTGNYPMALPRGLNSSVPKTLISTMKSKFGRAFLPINPDFSFAYNCLLSVSKIIHFRESLMVSQGLSISNGGTAYLTDASKYVESLGIAEPIKHSPIKALFVENIIAEDLFSACLRHNRQDILNRIDVSDLYIKCFMELNEKKTAKILAAHNLNFLEASLIHSLEKQPKLVQDTVGANLKKNKSLRSSARKFIKGALGKRIDTVRHFKLKFFGMKSYSSALEASGHKTT